jgi:hypothetical protein
MQTVLGGRPLVFMTGALANLTELQALRDACNASLGVEPYLVSMNNQAAPGVIDAQSWYTIAGEESPSGSPFQEAIVEPSLALWEAGKAAGVPIVPVVVRTPHVHQRAAGLCFGRQDGGAKVWPTLQRGGGHKRPWLV